MTDPSSALLAGVLNKTILVSAALVSMKLASVGAYALSLALVAPLGVLAYMRFTDAALLR